VEGQGKAFFIFEKCGIMTQKFYIHRYDETNHKKNNSGGGDIVVSSRACVGGGGVVWTSVGKNDRGGGDRDKREVERDLFFAAIAGSGGA